MDTIEETDPEKDTINLNVDNFSFRRRKRHHGYSLEIDSTTLTADEQAVLSTFLENNAIVDHIRSRRVEEDQEVSEQITDLIKSTSNTTPRYKNNVEDSSSDEEGLILSVSSDDLQEECSPNPRKAFNQSYSGETPKSHKGKKIQVVKKAKVSITGEDSQQKKAIILAQSILRQKLCYKTTPKPFKQWLNRHRVVHELLATEETYVDGLFAISNVYFKYLKMLPPENFDVNCLSKISNNLIVIQNYNMQFLKELEKRISEFFVKSEIIGDIVFKYSKLFKVYTEYVKVYATALMEITNQMEDLTVLQILERCRQQPATRGIALQGFLITPIQRIPRYQLLLQELLRNTPTDHPDYPHLTKAIDSIIEVANYVNEKKKQAENMNRVSVISSRLTGYPERLPQPHRLLEFEGKLQEANISEMENQDLAYILKHVQWRKRCLFVFSDILMSTKRPKKNRELGDTATHYRFVHTIQSQDYEIVNIPSRSQKYFFFALRKWDSFVYDYLYYTSSMEKKQNWMEKIDDVISILIKNQLSRIGLEDIHFEKPLGIEREGYLCKQSKDQIWKMRYFVLHDNILKLYKCEEDYNDGLEPSKVMDTLKMNIVRWPVSDRQYCFRIKMNGNSLFLHSGSETDRTDWINDIRKASRHALRLKNKKGMNTENLKRKKKKEPKKKNKSRRSLPTSAKRKSVRIYRRIGKRATSEKLILTKDIIQFHKDKQNNFQVDLSSLEPIDDQSIRVSRINKKEVYFCKLVDRSENTTHVIGFDSLEELANWIQKINSKI
eukprot:TRINITY_DN8201_c0_g1_i1.p1 TRINITY_DN8201_c0_g1~~TRINITY_DN8201_c0_g1_i1.p1  ORF type:complete len:779 (-),score=145.45 TRINITY_DN8201_c0_g1_i1:1-2337(-)